MAEYFPLLERAVAGLADATPEARRAIYDRARSALLGQLRNMDPPVPEENVARESTALDDAISRIEAAYRAPHPSAEPLPDVVVPQPPPSRPARVAPVAPRRTPAASSPPGLPSAKAPPVAAPLRERPLLAPRLPDSNGPQRPAAPLRAAPTVEAAEQTASDPQRSRLAARPLNTAPRIGIEPRIERPRREPLTSSEPIVSAPVDHVPVLPETSAPGVPVGETTVTRLSTAQSDRRPGEPASSGRLPGDTGEADAPQERRPGRGAGFYLALAVGALLVGGVAFEAWKLRDRPEQVTAAQRQTAAEAGGKVVDRAAAPVTMPAQSTDEPGDTTIVPPPVAASSQAPAAVSPPPQMPAPEPPSLAQPAVPQEQSSPSASTEAATSAAPNSPDQTQNASVGVTQRAALLVDAPQDPQKIKTYVGSVVWRNESVSTGQGQPLSDAILADIDIPDAKLTLSMVMKRNTEPQFPASHTIEFRFNDGAGNEIGPVKQINVPDMRLDDSAPTGDPLSGVPVAITDNSFLVGLSRGPAEAVNMQMLEKRNWIDVSLLLSSGRVAKITFEKGTPGQRIVDDAVRSWQSGG